MRTFEAWKAVYRDATCNAPATRAVVYDSTYKGKPLKNLGWLLRHAGDVESLEIGRYGNVIDTGTDDSSRCTACLMVARLRGGTVYLTQWADRTVCRAWIKRPSFRGLPLSWFGEETVC